MVAFTSGFGLFLLSSSWGCQKVRENILLLQRLPYFATVLWSYLIHIQGGPRGSDDFKNEISIIKYIILFCFIMQIH